MEEKQRKLISYRVPDLKLDLFPLNVDHPGTKLHSDGQVMNRLESLVCKLEQQTGFANSCNHFTLTYGSNMEVSSLTCITDDDIFEEISVRHPATLDLFLKVCLEA